MFCARRISDPPKGAGNCKHLAASRRCETKLALTLDSRLESASKAEQAARTLATQLGFNQDDVAQIMLAVREATTNAVVHEMAKTKARTSLFSSNTHPELSR